MKSKLETIDFIYDNGNISSEIVKYMAMIFQ